MRAASFNYFTGYTVVGLFKILREKRPSDVVITLLVSVTTAETYGDTIFSMLLSKQAFRFDIAVSC